MTEKNLANVATPRKDLSIIVPVYFNEGSLAKTMESVKKDVIEQIPGLHCEVIFVDDGSGDRSLEVLHRLREENPGLVRVIKLTRNFGQVSALFAGFEHARGDWVAAMSADGQDPASLILEMYRVHRDEAYQVVICTREGRDESLYRVWTSKLFYWLMRKLTFPNMPPGGFDFLSMSRPALNVLLKNHEAHCFLQGQVLWTGYKPKFIPYRRLNRTAGRSRWTFGKKLTYLIDGVLSFSYLPLRLMSCLGLLFAVLGFAYAVLIVLLKIFGDIAIQGWAPLMVVVLVMGGIQMLMTGVIGEYLWRVLAQVRNRAPYIIERIHN